MDSDSYSEEEIATTTFSKPDTNNPQPDDDTDLPEGNSNDSNDDDMDVQESVTLPAPSSTSRATDISFLCNPNNEDPSLRQPRISDLFDKELSSVQKRSWAKDSTCERFHLT